MCLEVFRIVKVAARNRGLLEVLYMDNDENLTENFCLFVKVNVMVCHTQPTRYWLPQWIRDIQLLSGANNL